MLVDHARAHQAGKRSGATIHVALNEASAIALEGAPEIIALDDALELLAQAHPQLARVVEMRFFAGLENQEIGEVLGVTAGRASQLWAAAQAWLRRELGAVAKQSP
ncbi:MAG: hypothetical protein HOP19_10175 [Acidobacteria bacterium]|nr:hypothetical protein [Acidobacteriota bacterium]